MMSGAGTNTRISVKPLLKIKEIGPMAALEMAVNYFTQNCVLTGKNRGIVIETTVASSTAQMLAATGPQKERHIPVVLAQN